LALAALALVVFGAYDSYPTKGGTQEAQNFPPFKLQGTPLKVRFLDSERTS